MKKLKAILYVLKKGIAAAEKLAESNLEDQDFQKKTLELLNDLKASNDKGIEHVKVLLRHEITTIYENSKEKKQLTDYEKQDLCYLYECYKSIGGNSYVQSIYEKMLNW